jgi:hypothetical protein
VSSNDGSVAILTLRYPLDLRAVPQPLLRFDSLLASSHSIAQLEISADGQVWQPIVAVQPSVGWQPVTVDLSSYQQQIIWLRWVWISQVPAVSQTADFWSVDNVVVADASMMQPTTTPTTAPSLIPSLPAATPGATETPAATLAPEATEAANQSTAEPTLLMPTETPTATTVMPEVTAEQTVEPLSDPSGTQDS